MPADHPNLRLLSTVLGWVYVPSSLSPCLSSCELLHAAAGDLRNESSPTCSPLSSPCVCDAIHRYFTSWTTSFYPQVLLNHKTKSFVPAA